MLLMGVCGTEAISTGLGGALRPPALPTGLLTSGLAVSKESFVVSMVGTPASASGAVGSGAPTGEWCQLNARCCIMEVSITIENMPIAQRYISRDENEAIGMAGDGTYLCLWLERFRPT
jgi:hypothetical protein